MKRCPQCATNYISDNWTCPACLFTPLIESDIPILAPELAYGGAGFHADFFAKLAMLEANNFWFRARNRLIIWALKRYVSQIHRYLEIGCGTGYVLAGIANAYPQANITGSEVFSVGLPFAAARVKKAELLQMDARRIPYTDEFDVIGAFDVLEHIAEDQIVLTEMHRALHSEGWIIITVPQHPWLWSQQDEHACHVRRYKINELREKVSATGFNVIFETSFVSLLLPAMLISRLRQSKTSNNHNHLTELQLPNMINKMFELIMNLERNFVRFGVRFPLGGSRLLIAKK